MTIARKAFSVVVSFVLVMSFALCIVPQNSYAVTQSEVDAVKAQLDAADTAASEAAESYYAALDAHDAAVTAMKEAQQKIDETTATLEDKQGHLRTRAVSMYRSGSPTLVDVFLNSASFSEFANMWNLLNLLNENDSELIEQVKELKAEQQAAYDEYAEQEKISAEQMQQAEIAKTEAEAKSATYASLYNSMSSELQAQIQAAQAAKYVSASTDTGSSNSSSNTSGVIRGGGSGVCNTSLAMAQVGKPYNYGATGPDSFDCSGLCYYCGAPYHSSAALYANAASRVPVSEAQAGDVLWTSGHVGISLGGNTYVHASDYGTGVIVSYNASSAFQYALRF